MIEFSQHVFATLTYSRNLEVLQTWQRVSKDYNRYLQKLRRLHNCKIEYLRVVEQHKDSYPHVHALLQYPSAQLRIENHKFFDSTLYKKWKSLWTHGHSDYQKPKRSGSGTISYLMKYLLKNQTAKTIWKKLLPVQISTPQAVKTAPIETLNAKIEKILAHPTHLNGVKLASWSRNFDWSHFTTSASK